MKKQSDARRDAPAKLDGSLRFIRDIKIDGKWFGTTVRSPHAHAIISDITFDPAFDWTSVTTVTETEIPVNYVAMLENDMPFLADKVVKYIGEPVVLIAGKDEQLVRQAKIYINITYEPLPAVFKMLESENNKVKIFKDNNVFKEICITKGQLDNVVNSADHVIELESETGFQEHLYMEPQGILAIPYNDRIEIHGSLQCPYYVKKALVRMFDDKKHITVIQSPTGGASVARS